MANLASALDWLVNVVRNLRCRWSIGQLQLMENEISCRIFLLSPAYAGGERARMILSESAQFDLAKRLRNKQGATIAEVFTFLSGLYFRGKIAYANAFARPIRGNLGRICYHANAWLDRCARANSSQRLA